VSALWTSDEIAKATGGSASAAFERFWGSLRQPRGGGGDLFVALKGESTDGHRFLDKAFAQGAAGAIVSEAVASACAGGRYHAALEALGEASRARMTGKVIGVTGSVGKTGTKEALFAGARAIQSGGGASVGQELQQPYRRAVEPRPDAADKCVRRVRDGDEPRRRTVGADADGAARCRDRHHDRARAYRVFRYEAAIAQAKAEIFEGLEPGGTAVIVPMTARMLRRFMPRPMPMPRA
jgi:UDP-N-acetylmuramoyl-tripeptide--D-alanyl-D-alanine ligase